MGSFNSKEHDNIYYIDKEELHDLCLTESTKYHKYEDGLAYKNIKKIDPDICDTKCRAIGKNPYKTKHNYSYYVVDYDSECNYKGFDIKSCRYKVKYITVSKQGYYMGPNNKYFIHKNSIPSSVINKIYNLIYGKNFHINITYLKTNPKKSGGYIIKMDKTEIEICKK